MWKYVFAAASLTAMGLAPGVVPPAAADDSTQPTCTQVGDSTECSTPGNVQINATPPVTTEPFFIPYWDDVYGGGYPVYTEGHTGAR
jgi:hypothetical protein